jgi:two-component system cell cycle sensor histidine kinase/response regulator CckA
MKSPLHILHLEDNPDDAALIQSTLKAEGIACAITRVQSRQDYVAALECGGIDLILSDFSLPAFDGLSAIEIARARWPDLPVILVSGTLGEELAIDSLKSGATDYVLKERLARLAPAVRRAMQEVVERDERKQVDVKLRENEADLAEAQRVARMGSWQYDLTSKKLRWSDELCLIFGIEKTLFDGRYETFLNCVVPGDHPQVLRMNAEARAGGTSFEVEYRIQTRAGDLKTIREIGYAMKDAEGKVVRLFGTAQDITGRKKLEAQFIEVQKMEVIGQLAGGVAHDFNNILAVIMGYSDLIASELAPDSPPQKYVDEIRYASERAAGLTRQLLVFSRKQTVQPVVLDLNAVVADMDKMLRRLIGENITMTIVPGKATGRILADSGYIGQVLMNLVINACDVMPHGGRLSIATSNVTLDESYTHTRAGVIPGDYVMLSVSDTGTGMTAEVKKHLFEPFFTTKPKGKGTGLGLATCQTIAQQCRGHISVYSELGQGTTFKVYFPRVEQAADASTKFVETSPVPRGTETLLFVEDDPSVRQLACGFLEAQGYTVLRANNGSEALHIARENKGSPIRLVVTDVIMPVMSGKVMAEWLQATYPDIKILFTSGYTDDAIAQHGMLEAGVAFLSKPYSPATLGRKVRAMLDDEKDSTFFRKQRPLVGEIEAEMKTPPPPGEAHENKSMRRELSRPAGETATSI